jgi:5-methyltetrahydropteroyltriglutamate--homocysteine methyltransferase
MRIDFTEGRLSLKLDASGGVLRKFIALNNQVLQRFTPGECCCIGVHSCLGGDCDFTQPPQEVCAGVLEAATFIPPERLDTTDDCGFAPFTDDVSTARETAFEKIRTRVEGTRMAEREMFL